MESIEELQLQVEESFYKNDVEVLLKVAEQLRYEKIEELKEKSRVQVINMVRRYLQEVIEGIESTTGKSQLLNDVFITLGGSPKVGPGQKNEELSKLLQEYEQLKGQQERQLLEMQAKIDKLELGVNDKSTKVNKENTPVIGVPSSTQGLLRRDFKISGQIGEPGQAEKLTFISLNHQIKSGLKQKYSEDEVVDAVIRAISLHTQAFVVILRQCLI